MAPIPISSLWIENALEISTGFVFLQESLHHGKSFRAGEVTGLGIQNLDVGIEGFAEAFCTADCCTGAGGSGELKDCTAIGQEFY